jgi:hypothetical protein
MSIIKEEIQEKDLLMLDKNNMKMKLLILLIILITSIFFSCKNNNHIPKNYTKHHVDNLGLSFFLPVSFINKGLDTIRVFDHTEVFYVFDNKNLGGNDIFQIGYYDSYENLNTDSLINYNFPIYIKKEKQQRGNDIWLFSGDTILNDTKFYVLESYRNLANDTVYYYSEFVTINKNISYEFTYQSKTFKSNDYRNTAYEIIKSISF